MRLLLEEHATLDHAIEHVWAHVCDPEHVLAWDAKLASVERSRSGPVLEHERYDAHYEMSNKKRPVFVEVQRVEAPTRLVLHEREPHWPIDRYVTVTYSLVRRDDRTEVTRAADLARSALPWPIKLLVWLMHRYGTPTGKAPLEALRDYLESRSGG